MEKIGGNPKIQGNENVANSGNVNINSGDSDGGGTPPGEGGRSEKMEILHRAMYANQPQFEDFEGKPGFSQKFIEDSKWDLKVKMAEIEQNNRRRSQAELEASQDEYAKNAEPILTYIFNDPKLFKTRESQAFLASEYDDKCNGSDIVITVENKKGRRISCAVDVATGTNPWNIRHKFEENAHRHGKTPAWCSYLKFCKFQGDTWTDIAAPHFTLGMMPSSLDKAVDHVAVEKGIIMGRDEDPDTDFMLLSEMREQIIVQKRYFKRFEGDEFAEKHLKRLNGVGNAVNQSLGKLLGVDTENPDKEALNKEFKDKYADKKKEMRKDLVYRNIMNECANIQMGSTAMRSMNR